jgi:hypothetical protein
MVRSTHKAAALVALVALGCAGTHHVETRNPAQLDVDAPRLYYVVVNPATEEVDYGYLWEALNYPKYAADREFKPGRPDVPTEIAQYLERRGKVVRLGPASAAPRDGSMVVVYKELWGWDMRDIIKSLTIFIYPAERRGDAAAVSFEELTIFNSQPTASSLVPQMLDKLFLSQAATGQP